MDRRPAPHSDSSGLRALGALIVGQALGLLAVAVYAGALVGLAILALLAFFLVLLGAGLVAQALPDGLPGPVTTAGSLVAIVLAIGLPVGIVVFGYRAFRRRIPDRWRQTLLDEPDATDSTAPKRATADILADVRRLDARLVGPASTRDDGPPD